jgi:hypothetical protein
MFRKEEHYTRFFGRWNSRFSLVRWRYKDGMRSGLYFRAGYVEIIAGKWKFRYRNEN